MQRAFILFVALMLPFVFNSPALAITDTFSNPDDSYGRSTSPSTNFGTEASVISDGVAQDPSNGNFGEVVGILKWNISSIPATATVSSASITVNLTNNSSGDYNFLTQTGAWTEGSVAWNNFNFGGTVLGSIPAFAFGSTTVVLNASGIALIQGWVDGSISNDGILIRTSGTNNSIAFDSKDSSGSPATLEVVYTNDPIGDGDPPEIDSVIVADDACGTGCDTLTILGSNLRDISNVNDIPDVRLAGSSALPLNAGDPGTTETVIVDLSGVNHPGDGSHRLNFSNLSGDTSISVTIGAQGPAGPPGPPGDSFAGLSCTANSVCGNGVVEAGGPLLGFSAEGNLICQNQEECDDGNTINFDGCEPNCTLCGADTFEPNDTQATAFFLGTITDADDDGDSILGTLNPIEEEDWYSVAITEDNPLATIDPRLSWSVELTACVYYQCTQGTTEVTCNSGTADVAPNGALGCCSISGPSGTTQQIQPNCLGGIDDSGTAYFRALKTPVQTQCRPFILDWTP